MEHQEMNLWDVLVLCANGIKNLLRACMTLFKGMVRLSYRQWWLVAVFVIAVTALAVYYSRPSNKIYKVNAVATLNGPSFREVADYFESMDKTYQAFTVVDCLNDGVADYVDLKGHHSPEDSVNVSMSDQIGLQFIVCDTTHIPAIEQRIMDRFNSQQQFIHVFNYFKAHMDRRYRFDQEQVDKLDSMTTAFYASAGSRQVQSNAWELVLGRQEIILPVKQIEQFMSHKEQRDIRYASCTAPVVLHGHFVPQKKAENGRFKCTALGLLIGWLLGCLVALYWERRRAIRAWLKQNGEQ